MIKNESGRHFDPAIVDAFLEVEAEFEVIAERCADPPEPTRDGDVSAAGSDVAARTESVIDRDLVRVVELLERAADGLAWGGPAPLVGENETSEPEEELAHVS